MSEPADSAPAASAGPAQPGPGARLRAAREQRGLALGAVAETLHVAPRMVVAMEANDFGAFDAPVYAKGFLRKYAGVLGLPVEEVLAAYDALSGGPSHPTLIPAMSVGPVKAAPMSLPPAPLLWAAAALLLAVGAYWWWGSHARNALSAETRAAAEHEAPVVGTLLSAQQPVSADASPPEPAKALAETGPRPVETAPAPLPAAVPATPAAAPAARHRAAAATATREEALVIHGVRECWVEVYAPGGARLVYDLVHPGETLSAQGPGPWRVFLGFADGARLTVGERTVNVPQGRRAAATARFVVGRDGAAQ